MTSEAGTTQKSCPSLETLRQELESHCVCARRTFQRRKFYLGKQSWNLESCLSNGTWRTCFFCMVLGLLSPWELLGFPHVVPFSWFCLFWHHLFFSWIFLGEEGSMDSSCQAQSALHLVRRGNWGASRDWWGHRAEPRKSSLLRASAQPSPRGWCNWERRDFPILGSFKAGEKLWKILWKRHREFVPGEPKEGLPKALKKLLLPSAEGETKKNTCFKE